MAWQPSYVGLDDLKSYLKVPYDSDDVQLTLAIAAASRSVDAYCRRQFGKTDAPESRTFNSRTHHRHYWDWWRSQGCQVFDTDDFIGTVTVTDSDSTVLDYSAEPVNAPNYGRPFTRLVVSTPCHSVAVSGTWGWTSIPDVVVQAVLIQASRTILRRNSPFGVLGSPSEGSELRLLNRLDVDVQVLLAQYRRIGAVG